MQFRVLTAVLAVSQAIKLRDESDHEENLFEFPKGTDDIIEFLNEEVGNEKWKPPHEKDTFEKDLNNLLEDFYDKAGAEFGDR